MQTKLSTDASIPYIHTQWDTGWQIQCYHLGKGQTCSSKAQIFPVIRNKTSQFDFHASVNLCWEDPGDSELVSSCLPWVSCQWSWTGFGHDAGTAAQMLQPWFSLDVLSAVSVATQLYDQCEISWKVRAKWAFRHQYGMIGLFLIFLWRNFLSLSFGVITIALVPLQSERRQDLGRLHR